MQNKDANINNKYADVPIRIRSWLAIIIILAIALLHPLLTILFICMLSYVAMKEFMSMYKCAIDKKTNIGLALLASIQFYVVYTNNYILLIAFVIAYIFIMVVSQFRYRNNNRINTLEISTIVILSIFSISHLALITYLPIDNSKNLFGIKLLLYLIITTELNDVFQYLSGKKYGKHKIAPAISPNKTIEGLIGGIILTTLLSNLLGPIALPRSNHYLYTLIGLSISIIGFLGDLYLSSIKRKMGVKDSGTLIPGHGGLLDRIDSLLFISPIYYWLVYVLLLA